MKLSNIRPRGYAARMSRHSPSLLSRLRRHRGLMMLAIAVLMLKFVGGTVCLANDTTQQAAWQATTITTTLVDDAAHADAFGASASDCVLGEPGGCHCSCSHNMPLTVAALIPLLRPSPANLHLPGTARPEPEGLARKGFS